MNVLDCKVEKMKAELSQLLSGQIFMNFVEVAVACKISYVPAIVLNSMQ